MTLKLYSYWRSSASHRVRIALALKGLDYEYVPVHLVRGGGEQYSAEYRALNPQQRVPMLAVGDARLTQSSAIVEWLEERYPQPALLPDDADGRARVRSLALIFIADVQPLQNLPILNYLRQQFAADDAAVRRWLAEWLGRGLAACETRLSSEPESGRYSHGDAPGLVEVCLIPQLCAARRFGVAVDSYPTLLRIESACLAQEAFQRAAPERQPDAER